MYLNDSFLLVYNSIDLYFMIMLHRSYSYEYILPMSDVRNVAKYVVTDGQVVN